MILLQKTLKDQIYGYIEKQIGRTKLKKKPDKKYKIDGYIDTTRLD